jgi:hypothetical protein
LRPMLVDHIPWFKPTDTKFVGNFGRKAVKFFMANLSNSEGIWRRFC